MKIYTVEDSKRGQVEYEEWMFGRFQKNAPWREYEKMATGDTARNFSYRPKSILFGAFLLWLMLTITGVALGLYALAFVGFFPLVLAWFVKWPGQQWYFRKGNPVPVPGLDDLYYEDPKDGSRHPILSRSLDGTVELIRQSEESKNVSDLVASPLPWMIIAMVAMTALAIGISIGAIIFQR